MSLSNTSKNTLRNEKPKYTYLKIFKSLFNDTKHNPPTSLPGSGAGGNLSLLNGTPSFYWRFGLPTFLWRIRFCSKKFGVWCRSCVGVGRSWLVSLHSFLNINLIRNVFLEMLERLHFFLAYIFMKNTNLQSNMAGSI